MEDQLRIMNFKPRKGMWSYSSIRNTTTDSTTNFYRQLMISKLAKAGKFAVLFMLNSRNGFLFPLPSRRFFNLYAFVPLTPEKQRILRNSPLNFRCVF
jgi:hypothetical protein